MLIQLVPKPGRNFGTRGFCGFGITTSIPGFIKNYFQDSFDVDYRSGCEWILGNTWVSVWELYDAANKRLDKNKEYPFGGYSIEPDKINKSTPGDGKAKWSLWYRVSKSQPWLTSDSDAYPYNYVLFDVYSSQVKDPNTKLKTEHGPVQTQWNFQRATGGTMELTYVVTTERATSKSQKATTTVKIGGERSASLKVPFKGLEGGFENKLNWEATQAITKEKGLVLRNKESLSGKQTFTLKPGQTTKIMIRPLYQLIDGSVDLISHRDGVITGKPTKITGAIRRLVGFVFQETVEETPK